MDNSEDDFSLNFENSEDDNKICSQMERVKSSSRVNFSKLSEIEKNIRLKNMAQEIRKLRKQLRSAKTQAIKKQQDYKFQSLSKFGKVLQQAKNLKLREADMSKNEPDKYQSTRKLKKKQFFQPATYINLKQRYNSIIQE
ncbi:UNKNOWN [Stylonychia lemnae]|uniref:Uncharacterized protein n=1 Tax=Stylonychia lemnae TaxID=5949 RepID=A0A078A187_STYLE|nr:UNKNOWN [Stylonychia lemnae]|eukprot:CDW76021.1 UNKNOWN [Stylonychia lemnae]